ncbi:unnamed protein product [Alopecurus aequalis]
MGNSAPVHGAPFLGRIRSETSSTCSTESVTAAHNFEVRHYELLQCGGGGKAICSSEFRVGGYNWTIEFYPDGAEKDKSSDDADCFVRCPSLRDSLEHMLKDGQGADVTFNVREQRFNAHRCVLAARSPVFEAELYGPMKESATRSIIKVDDMEPQTFEALLHFIYTDAMLDDDDDDEGKTHRLQHLLVAAGRYGVDTLRVMCEDKLYEGVDVETVATTLLLAEQQNCKDLKEACIEFMGTRNILGAVMATKGFKQLVARCPFLMEHILKEVAGAPLECEVTSTSH